MISKIECVDSKSKGLSRPRLAGERGFTLVELLVGITIMAMVTTVLASGISQAFKQATFQRTGLTSQDESRRLYLVITRDLQIATVTDLVDGAAPVSSVTITSVDPNTSATHTTAYSLSGTNLLRNVDGVPMTAGRNISAIGFSRSGSLFTVTATATSEGNANTAVASAWNVYKRTTP